MGRTIPSVAQMLMLEQQNYRIFRGALGSQDRFALDGLFSAAHQHTAEAAYAASPLPMQIFLLSMLLEYHKDVMRAREQLNDLQTRVAALSKVPISQAQPGD